MNLKKLANEIYSAVQTISEQDPVTAQSMGLKVTQMYGVIIHRLRRNAQYSEGLRGLCNGTISTCKGLVEIRKAFENFRAAGEQVGNELQKECPDPLKDLKDDVLV